VVELGGAPVIMGILNVTADSFFDGGQHALRENALAQAKRMVAEGAAIIDVGGQSTRPGFVEISVDEEIARVVPVIEQIVREVGAVVSIDTYKPAVARAALEAGAHVLNDIHGLQGAPEMARLAANFNAGVVAMHHDERFRDYVRRPGDTAHGIAVVDPIGRMKTWLSRSLEVAAAAGVSTDRVVLDPGIGFFKTQEQNLEIIGRLGALCELGCPLLLGASRKSFIGRVLDGQAVEDRIEGTLAATTLAVWQGVQIVRVHDVAANVRAARMAQAIRAQSSHPFHSA
jgi:dihydropteroate synthase